MALVKCPHCATENDTRHRSAEDDRVARCRQCGFVFVTAEMAERVIRSGAADPDPDEPRTAISSGPAVPPPVSGPTALTLTLTATAGVDVGKVWPLQKPLVFIGRRNADVVLGDQETSRQHCVIELHGEKYLLKDLGSTNGTHVDDAKVSVAEIRDGSRIRIGDTVLLVAIGPAAGEEG